jgi:hypothetical protein
MKTDDDDDPRRILVFVVAIVLLNRAPFLVRSALADHHTAGFLEPSFVSYSNVPAAAGYSSEFRLPQFFIVRYRYTNAIA